ncbi:hypothetical protein, partial [Rodentibacter caecimuris]|uniref:hypothetical protein n=1 Tax=Rodentibacter caecimuris TaxID=1796644 RepID=UPI001C4E0C6C
MSLFASSACLSNAAFSASVKPSSFAAFMALSYSCPAFSAAATVAFASAAVSTSASGTRLSICS